VETKETELLAQAVLFVGLAVTDGGVLIVMTALPVPATEQLAEATLVTV
jgi:hypothetical protein